MLLLSAGTLNIHVLLRHYFLHFQFVNSSGARITYGHGIVQFNVPLLKGVELAPNPNYSGGSYSSMTLI